MSLGIRLYTFFYGTCIGEDDQGNKYYHDKKQKRRWIMYNGEVEASRIPPEWHRWLHRTSEKAPTEQPLETQAWEQPHQSNLTGTVEAYVPTGHISRGGKRKPTTGDYQSWQPE
jgi:NADH:ubiquinone oxidoreductase subunit